LNFAVPLNRLLSRRKRDDSRPPLFLHAGLHKTGTTALQVALHHHAARLLAGGILYPESGIPAHSHGHHNLAWELTRDRRFRAHFGTTEDAVREIAAHGGPAILSSEDFETMLDRPTALDALAAHPDLAGHRVVLVIYLRDPCAYFRSLFLELTARGLAQEMQAAAETILANGFLDFKEWRFQFDYDRMFRRLRAWHTGTFLPRSYPGATGSTVSDFLSLACPGLAVPDDEAQERLHVTPPLSQILERYFTTRLDAPLNAAQRDILHSACAGDREAALSVELTMKLRSAFGASRAGKSIGLRSDEAIAPAAGPPPEWSLDRLFSFEMQNWLTCVMQA
jgi:hypothetical protein